MELWKEICDMDMYYLLITVCSQVGDRGVVITTPVRLPQDNEGLSITDIVRQSPVPVLIAHACKPKRALNYLQFHFHCLTGLWKASHVSTNVDVGHKLFMSSILAGVVLSQKCWSPLMGVLSGRKWFIPFVSTQRFTKGCVECKCNRFFLLLCYC